MRSYFLPAVLLLSVALCSCASSPPPSQLALAQPTGAHRFLRGSDCLDPRMVRRWVDVGQGVVLVDAGRYKYRIELAHCPDANWSPQLRLRGSPISGRVCGGAGDAILTRDYTCAIGDMQVLDEPQYDELIDDYEARRKSR